MDAKRSRTALALVVGIVAASILLMTCRNPLQFARAGAIPRYATLTVSAAESAPLSSTNARTLRPTGTSLSAASYTYHLEGPAGTVVDDSDTTGTKSFSLLVGSWSVTITEKNSEGAILRSGTASFALAAGDTKTVPVTMSRPTATGTVSLTFSFPAAIVTGVTGTLDGTDISSKITYAGGSGSYADTLSAGTYLLRLHLINGQGNTIGWIVDDLDVFAGITTDPTITLSESDLNAPPSAPQNLVAAAGDSQVSLTWDTVLGAMHYTVYRSTTSGTQGSAVASPTDSSYTDTDVTNGTTYYYQVTATNVAGDSAPTGQIWAIPFVPPTMMNVAGGTFQRDSTSTNLTTVSSFSMSRYEITGSLYAAVTGITDPSTFATTDHPAEQVNWYGALVFCNRLSMSEGKTPVYTIGGSTDPADWGTIPTSSSATWDAVSANWSAEGYRLPTEMEYMWAMMGGVSDWCPGNLVDGINAGGYNKGYAGSREPDGGIVNIGEYAWSSDNSVSTHSVGTKASNELQLHDLSGNVWEWCWDWYATYTSGPQTDPTGPETGSRRIVRGGAWYIADFACAVSNGYNYYPYWTTDFVGFRVVRSLPSTQYILSYNANGATEGATPLDENLYSSGTSAQVADAGTLSRTGYAFGGWNTAPDGSGTNYAPNAPCPMNGNVTLFAQWDLNSPMIGILKSVSGGTFQRDSTSTNLTTVSSFWMSKYEITGDQYNTVTGLTDPSYFTESDHPVERVNWYGALVFCNRLSIAEGKTPVYTINGSTDPSDWGTIPTSSNATWNAAQANWSADGYRLPTEMEYMWAMMGGMSDSCAGDIVGGVNTRGYNKGYAGSSETGGGTTNIGSYAWYSDNSGGTTHAVGTRTANELGLHDLSGNVFEWCWDWYGSYPSGAQTDPSGPETGTCRVLRGGSWDYYGDGCAVSYRYNNLPYNRNFCYGFRVVRSLP